MIYYVSSEDPKVEYISQEGPENTLFTKAIRKRLLIETWALLRSSILAVFHRLVLSVEDEQNLASNSQEMTRSQNSEDKLLDARRAQSRGEQKQVYSCNTNK